MYTSARTPPHHGVPSLAPFLPQGRSTYYPPAPAPPPLPPSGLSPNSRRAPASSKAGRPFSADVGRLLSVQEGSENGDEARAKVKGKLGLALLVSSTRPQATAGRVPTGATRQAEAGGAWGRGGAAATRTSTGPSHRRSTTVSIAPSV